jgi:hypothetical protein
VPVDENGNPLLGAPNSLPTLPPDGSVSQPPGSASSAAGADPGPPPLPRHYNRTPAPTPEPVQVALCTSAELIAICAAAHPPSVTGSWSRAALLNCAVQTV